MDKNVIYDVLKSVMESSPDSPAVIEDGRRISFSQLGGMIDAADRMLPPSPGKRVGVVMRHGAEMIAVIFAIFRRGAAYVPAEPSFPPERIRYMMHEAGVDFVAHSPGVNLKIKGIPSVKIPSLEARECSMLPAGESRPSDTAYILYTSGTTGAPKGVMVTNANVCHYARAFAAEFHPGAGDVMLQYSVCSFDIFVEEVFASLLNGAAIAIPSDEVKADIGLTVDFAGCHGVTEISGFPYLVQEMCRHRKFPAGLRLLISGGDVLRKKYIENLPAGIKIYNTYGPSETTVCASYFDCTGKDALADGTFPIGKPVKDVVIRIVDDDMREVPKGTVGEICISGPGVSSGYLKECPESANFTVMPGSGERVYRSGDLGYILPDGNIAFLHRKDTQVMIFGKRVECEEVENVLCGCAGVAQGVVCPFTDNKGLSYLVAYIVPRKGRFSLHALRRRMARFLTSFMIPEFFVKMKSLPLTPNGKVNRSALPVILKDDEL